MNKQTQANSTGIRLGGDPATLTERLGMPELEDFAGAGGAVMKLGEVHSPAEFRDFLFRYVAEVLARSEFPAICQAYHHVALGHARELIALDAGLRGKTAGEPLANASRCVGRAQLQKLRPLRDHRCVQRYLAAVESGEAAAWHPVVFGLVLAVYSLPLRQGLQHYSLQIVDGFVHAAAGKWNLRCEEIRSLIEEALSDLPGMIENAVRAFPADNALPAAP